MLTIKDFQIETFTKNNQKDFALRLKKHLENHFNHIISKLQKEELVFFIEAGIKKAGRYKLETEYQVTVYFNFMLTFGPDFELDKKFDWASQILNDKQTASDHKIGLLIENGEEVLQEVNN